MHGVGRRPMGETPALHLAGTDQACAQVWIGVQEERAGRPPSLNRATEPPAPAGTIGSPLACDDWALAAPAWPAITRAGRCTLARSWAPPASKRRISTRNAFPTSHRQVLHLDAVGCCGEGSFVLARQERRRDCPLSGAGERLQSAQRQTLFLDVSSATEAFLPPLSTCLLLAITPPPSASLLRFPSVSPCCAYPYDP